MDWKQYGWRCDVDGRRYEVESHGAITEAWFVEPETCVVAPVHSGDGFASVDEAFAACERHNSERLAKTGE